MIALFPVAGITAFLKMHCCLATRHPSHLLAAQSGAHRITPHRDPEPSQSQPIPTQPTYSSGAGKPGKDRPCAIFLHALASLESLSPSLRQVISGL